MEQANGIAAPDNTGEQQALRWQPGQSGNPNGRPKGSRNRISEAALKALADDFDAHGVAVIEKVRTERPHDYLKIIVAVLPKRMEIEDATPEKHPSKMTDDELEAIIWKTQKQLEEMGVEQALTEDDLTQARARRIAWGERP
jgi:hypothetical protein